MRVNQDLADHLLRYIAESKVPEQSLELPVTDGDREQWLDYSLDEYQPEQQAAVVREHLRHLIRKGFIEGTVHEELKLGPGDIFHGRLPDPWVEVVHQEAYDYLDERVSKSSAYGLEQRESSEQKLRVFLCHASADKENVRQIYRRLTEGGFKPWLDDEDLMPGQDWKTEIPRAVRASHVVLVCLSNHSVGKFGYVQKEIQIALDVAEEQPEGTIFIIPAKLEECELPERLGQWHSVDLFTDRGFKKLTSTLERRASEIGEPHASGDSVLPQTDPLLDNLSREARTMVREIAQDDSGSLIYSELLDGT
jgi:hypothetical protein